MLVRQWLMPIISTTQEVESGKITVQGQYRQKVSKQTSWVWWNMPAIPAMWEVAEGK
jgi:hypothetical protein